MILITDFDVMLLVSKKQLVHMNMAYNCDNVVGRPDWPRTTVFFDLISVMWCLCHVVRKTVRPVRSWSLIADHL